jgi:hypothetical protein
MPASLAMRSILACREWRCANAVPIALVSSNSSRYFSQLGRGFPDVFGLLDDVAVIVLPPGHELVVNLHISM